MKERQNVLLVYKGVENSITMHREANNDSYFYLVRNLLAFWIAFVM